MSQSKKNQPFSMGASLGDGWNSDNRTQVIRQEKILAVDKHELIVKKEKRKGKTVTMIGEFFHSAEVKKKLSADLKKKLSTGGSVSETWLEFQGDVVEAAKALLVTKGYSFKR